MSLAHRDRSSKFELRQVYDDMERRDITRSVLEALPDWFGIPEAREEYICDSEGRVYFCACHETRPIGFLYLKETSRDTVELAAIGIRKEYHGKGLGTALVGCAKRYAQKNGYAFLQVKTVQMGRYEAYDRTNLFYRALGFKEFELFPTLWGERNPCQIYIMSLSNSERPL